MKNSINSVTVIGLGQMGSALAKLLLQNGYDVTVWNRTYAKTKELSALGANTTDSISAAVEASDTIVVCVFDYKASAMIFDQTEVKKVVNGRTFIQFTTGSPQEAKDSEAWFQSLGAFYLDGAIQVAPEQMAKSDTMIFISGAKDIFQRSEALLKIFGGNVKYLGEQISAASSMDLASLSYLYGSLLGFFHAVRICEAEGFPVGRFGDIIRENTANFIEFIAYEAKVIASGDFAITQSPLSISVEATEKILKASYAYKINSEVPELFTKLFKQADEMGYGKEELAALIKIFRNSSETQEGVAGMSIASTLRT